VSSLAFENDIKVGLEFFDLAGESYRKVRNTLRFMLSNLSDYVPSAQQRAGRSVAVDKLSTIDPASIHAWVVAAAASLQAQVRGAYEEFAFRRAHQLLYDFCNDMLSAFYCEAVKDRLYCDRPASPRRRLTQMVMWELAEMLCRLLAPLLPHTADEAYRALWEPIEGAGGRCAHLERYLDVPPVSPDPGWAALMAFRESAQRALEQAKARGIDNPLDAEVVVPDPQGTLGQFEPDLADVLGVSRVRLAPGGELAVNDLRDEPRCDRCWRRDATCAQRRDGGMLCDRCAEAVGMA
jgi:isoleucyl-tRNA synthetase